jgi:hypothetical protein
MSQSFWKLTHAASASWTIKGVQETTREAVREAAARTEMLIGEWVDEALTRAARAALHPAPPPATQADVATIRHELAELKAALQTLTRPPDRGEREELAELKTMLQALTERAARAERLERQERPVVRHVLVEQKRPARLPVHREPGGKGDRGRS